MNPEVLSWALDRASRAGHRIASGESLTVFLKGYHPFAEQGGAALFDDVSVVDLGL